MPVLSHERSTGLAGCTLSAAATDARSIGVAKAIVTAAVRSRSVENVVANAAWLSGPIGLGWVAMAVAG